MLLIVGGTGDLGSRVVRRLREHDADVRCLVRPTTEATSLRDLGADVVGGDLTDSGSLVSACSGVDTVVATATVIGRRLAGARKPSIHEVDEVGMASLIDAAESSDVRRFVYTSYAGADVGLGAPLERAKVATEKRLASSGMQTVVVRPDAFQEIHLGPLARFDMAAGKVAVIGAGDTKRRWVSTDDVADLIAIAAVEPDPPAVITFGGPESISKNEAIAVAERLTGRTFKVRRMPTTAARLAMRLLSKPNDALASVFGAGLLQDLHPGNWDDQPLRDRGITGKPASEFLREQAQLLT
jgi:uncharacterized protein YbjT (DUF2867 family)